MVITTLEDLQRLYPGIIPRKKVSNIKDKPIHQVNLQLLVFTSEICITQNTKCRKFCARVLSTSARL